MRFTNRAAAIAAAILFAVAGIFPAGPSRAWELTIPPEAAPELSAPVPEPTNFLPVEPAPVAPAPAQAERAAPEPEAPEQRSLPELVADYSSSRTASAEHECLANAVYFESKGESLRGQLSVAQVVLNRARSGRFASSICGVVKQRGQFSFVRRGRLPSVPRASAAWKKAVAVAHVALEDLADSPASRALFFHARRVKPGWRGLTRVATVGNHIFYR
jgi:spore germination cell wall hydrolase CwlJ-like protein